MPRLVILLASFCFSQAGAPFIATNVDTKAGIFKNQDDKGPKRGVCLFVTRPCDSDSTKTMSAVPGRCNEADPPYTIFQILPATFCAINANNSQDSTQLRILADIPEQLITFMERTKADFDTDSVMVAQKWKLDTRNGWTQDDKNRFAQRGYVLGQAQGQLKIEARICTLCP